MNTVEIAAEVKRRMKKRSRQTEAGTERQSRKWKRFVRDDLNSAGADIYGYLRLISL